MRKSLFLKIGMSIAIILSCGSDEDSGLTMTVTPNKTFFLPGDITFSDNSDTCYDDGTVSSPRFRLDTIETAWNGEGSFQPILMKISFNALGDQVSNYECVISGRSDSSLGQFLGYSSASVNTGENATSSCNIHCGGVSILDEDASFTVSAKVRLVGIQTKLDESQVPISIEQTVSLQNVD